jgi:hypothetical protein
MEPLKLPDNWYGLTPPATSPVQAAYGCRAILAGRDKNQYVDIVHDRQRALPQPVPAAFATWINKQLTKWLQAKCGLSYIPPDGAETYKLDDGLFHAIACPNRSYGYLYVGAWMDVELTEAEEEEEEILADQQRAKERAQKIARMDEIHPGWREQKHKNGNPVWGKHGMLLNDDGTRSVFDDLDE